MTTLAVRRRIGLADPASQIIIAVLAGIAAGILVPQAAEVMKLLGDLFIRLVRMFVGLIIFCTVVHGIASVRQAGRVGRVVVRALIYFELVTTLALILAMIVINLTGPGRAMHLDPASLSTAGLETYVRDSHHVNAIDFLLHLVPTSVVGAFAEGDILQVLVVSLFFAFAAQALGEKAAPAMALVDTLSKILFKIIGYVMLTAPLGAFGAIGYTVARFGAATLLPLLNLALVFYGLCGLFVLIVLWPIAAWNRIPLFRLIRYIGAELATVFGTSSSESVLPQLVGKLERLGADEAVVGLVLPTGYAFNHDGTCMYFAAVSVFLAQAVGIEMSLWQQLGLLGIMLLTSKGGAGVAGSAIVVLASTIAATGIIPVGTIAIILGVHRILSSAMVPVNVLGNALATLVLAKAEGALDEVKLRQALLF